MIYVPPRTISIRFSFFLLFYQFSSQPLRPEILEMPYNILVTATYQLTEINSRSKVHKIVIISWSCVL